MRSREDNLLQSKEPNTIRHTGRREGDTGPQGSSVMSSATDRWSFVEPAVWSRRMLKALEEGVKGGRWYSLMDTTFKPLDEWIRMRLRSILRKRCGLRGRGRGRDHHRWPIAYFHELGLFSFVAAHASCRRPTRW